MAKESDPFYHTARWKKVRALVIQRSGGMCEDCMALFRAGLIRRPHRATMVHHIVELKARPDLALDPGNLVALCDECHNKRHPEKGGAEEKKPPGRMRIIKV